MTALVKLLPPPHAFPSCSWERCEGGLSGHDLYGEYVQTKTAGNNDWMPLLKISDILQNNNAEQKRAQRQKGMLLQCRIFLLES